MAVRTSMAALIALVRKMINDPSGATQQFADQDIQDRLDASRDDVRYENLILAPSFVNTNVGGTLVPQTVYADYYSKFGYWEDSVVLQGYSNGTYWAVLTPVSAELMTDQAHWMFEADPFGSPSVPGQLPPLFATGKVYDPYHAAADLLEFWAATSLTAYDVTTDGQTFHRSQMTDMRMKAAAMYRRKAKPRIIKQTRADVPSPMSTRRIRSLDEDDQLKGGY
jgi:hypothetical protein